MRTIFAQPTWSWILRLLAAIFTALLLTNQAGAQDRKPVPERLTECINTAIAEFILVDGDSEEKVRGLFDKHTDRQWLGTNTYGHAWNNEDEEWRTEGVKQYFEFLFSKGKKTSGNMTLIPESIKTGLATTADQAGDGTKGYWHIVFTAILISADKKTQRPVAGAALVLESCKFFDLAIGGVWISREMEASAVDLALRKRQ